MTLVSSLNVSGFTTLSNNTTINSSLYVSGMAIFENNVGIGQNNPTNKLKVMGTSNFSGDTTGSNPIIKISQNTAWDSLNYALYVNGYTYLNGFRINGSDGARSLYNQTNHIGFAVGNTSVITFSQSSTSEKCVFIQTDLLELVHQHQLHYYM